MDQFGTGALLGALAKRTDASVIADKRCWLIATSTHRIVSELMPTVALPGRHNRCLATADLLLVVTESPAAVIPILDAPWLERAVISPPEVTGNELVLAGDMSPAGWPPVKTILICLIVAHCNLAIMGSISCDPR